MNFTLEIAKQRLGIIGTEQDALVQHTLDLVIDIVERYCNRLFHFGEDRARFYFFTGRTLFVPRYPIDSVLDITGIPSGYRVHSRMGALVYPQDVYIHDGEVHYVGGYQNFPADLLFALWGVFDTLWPVTSGVGKTIGGDIESVTIPDVGTIRFAKSIGAGGGAADDSATVGGILLNPYVDILRLYRRETC